MLLLALILLIVIALAFSLLKRRMDLALANVAAIPLWLLLLGPGNDALPGVVVFGFALILLAVIAVGIFGEPAEDSPWVRGHGDALLAFAGRLVGVALMIGPTIAIGVAYALYGTVGGAIVMAVWTAVLVKSFVPDTWAARPRRLRQTS